VTRLVDVKSNGFLSSIFKQLLFKNCAVNFVEICNVCTRKVIIKAGTHCISTSHGRLKVLAAFSTSKSPFITVREINFVSRKRHMATRVSLLTVGRRGTIYGLTYNRTTTTIPLPPWTIQTTTENISVRY